jgi:HAD superfamily hydrolase (TIGR01509 family)
MIQAVFFDLYETLITEFKDGKKKATHSVEIGVDQDIFKKEWRARKEQRMDGTFPDYRSCLIDILQSQGNPIDEKAIKKCVEDRVKAKSINFDSIDEGIISTIQKVKEMGIKVGLISNCATEEVAEWETCSLPQLFDDVIFSYKVKCAKPYPEIYLLACKNLNVSPEQSIFVGDGGYDELPGAFNAGMRAYHATWYQPAWKSKEITQFPKLDNPAQLIDVVRELNESTL